MKESDIKKMSLDEINRRMGMSCRVDELSVILDTNDQELIQDLIVNLKKATDLYQLLSRKLKGNEDKINKVALILITLNSYLRNYDQIIKTIRTSNSGTLEDRKNREKLFDKYIEEAKKILGDSDLTIFIPKYNFEGNSYVEALNSQELITGKKRNVNKKKIKELETEGLDLIHIANSIALTDLASLVCDPQLGSYLRYQSFYNTAMEKGIIKEDDRLIFNSEEQIEELREQMTYEEMLPQIADALEENIEYINFEKLLLCSAFRHIEFLEGSKQIDKEAEEEVERRLRIIQSYLKGKNVRIQGRIEKQNKREYIDVLYRVKDFEKDMLKFRGSTYFGKARVEDIKEKLFLGEVQLGDLPFTEFKINTEEAILIARANNDNYVYLIKNGLVDANIINKINTMINTMPIECIRALQERNLLSEGEIVELYLQGKVTIEDITALQLDLEDKVKPEDIYSEFSKENNEDRIEKMSELYKTVLAGQIDEEHKEEIYNAYLNSLDARYLEIFLKLGTLDFKDLNGIMTASEWVEALEKNEISEEFFFNLQQNGIIAVEDIRENKKALLKQLKIWEAGTIDSKYVETLGISIDELLAMCDNGDITGKKIHELLHSVEERDSVRRKIKSSYIYGMFNTIRPGFACYNNNLISRDNAISLANQMRTQEQEIVDSCIQGILSGEKIAEIYYGHLISKQAFLKIKEMGLVTEQEEINALNNLTPEEMISELEENGCEQVVDIEEIIRESTALKGHTKRDGNGTLGYRKQVINPMARNKLLEVLGADKIVTTPEQGFKGYQVYLIPRLNIAVMEKMFRVNKDKEVKPAYGDATYICELGKFLMVAGQSKQEIRAFMEVEGSSNGRVEIIEHRKNWGSKLLDAVAKVNSAISIQKDKNKKIQQVIKNDDEVSIDLQKLNDLIERIRQGDYSLNLEDYE